MKRRIWLRLPAVICLLVLLVGLPDAPAAQARQPALAGGPATLVVDLNPGVNWSYPSELLALGEQVVFMANDEGRSGCWREGGTWGCEPWVSDGTAVGTRMLADVDPGWMSPVFSEYLDEPEYLPANPVRIGRRLLFHFLAASGSLDQEIWFTDGTPAGTGRLLSSRNRRHCPNLDYCSMAMTPVGDHYALVSIYAYYPELEENRVSLWLTNGTPGGTVHVASFKEMSPVTVLGERVLFFADDERHGLELWTSDGTIAGTRILRELRPGPVGVSLYHTQLVGEELWFMADAGAAGTELWASNGSAAGTRLITTIPLDPNGLKPIDMTAAGNQLFFVINNTLWVSDGSAAGTRSLLSVTAPEECWSNEEQTLTCWRPTDLHTLGETFLFSVPRFVPRGTDPPTYDLMMDIWTSDGTLAGTRPAPWMTSTSEYYDTYIATVDGRYIIRRAFHENGSFMYEQLLSLDPADWSTIFLAEIGRPGSLMMQNGRFFFSGSDPQHGSELWMSDGTPAGTRILQDINPGPADSQPQGYAPGSRALFFSADDGVHGYELWRLPLLALEPFPTTPILDSFNRRAGPLGLGWRGPNLGSYRINSNQIAVQANGVVSWPTRFAADQEAYVTLVQVDPDGIHSLLLKVESRNDQVGWQYGTIRVSYYAGVQKLRVETFQPGKGWQSLAAWPASLGDGSVLGARALHNGVVQVYADSALIGSADTSASNPGFFDDDSGRIGLWMRNAADAVLDDFGGGVTP